MNKWEYKTLDQMGSVQRGRSKHRPRNDARLFGGQYPFIQTADVKNAPFYISEYTETYNEMGLAQSKLWDIGTLCITIAANIADTGILAIPACFPDSVLGFRAYDDISDVRFVKYCFDILQKDCKQISQGTAQDNLSWEKLSTIKFPCPPIEVQRKIADVLSAYDDLIENNRKQIKLLEEAAQRLYKEWFIDLRFPGYATTPIIDGIPAEWEKKTVGQLLNKFERTKQVQAADYLETGLFPIIDQSRNFIAGYTNDAETLIQHSQPIIVFGDHTRILKLISFPFAKGADGTQIVVSNDSDMPQHLFYCSLREIDLSNYHYARHFKYLKAEEILVPTKKIAQKIEMQLSYFFTKIQQCRNVIIKSESARNILLPKLMTGELEV